MSAEPVRIEILSSPHVKRPVSTDVVMLNVALALLPIVAFSFYCFGISALLLVAVTTMGCVLAEHGLCVLARRETSIRDYSAAVTGLLLGLTLPPSFPLWMGFFGGVISIALGKALFGGLGYNPFNPALVGRAFLQAAFPVAITTWTPALAPGRFLQAIPSTLAIPFTKAPSVAEFVKQAAVDGFSGATPLNLEGGPATAKPLEMFFGMTSGSTGETCAALILLCGAYLAMRKMLNWRIPVAVLGSVFLLSAILQFVSPERCLGPFYELFAGGLMLGAVFMATDMVTSPTTPLGIWIFGVMVGVVTLVIRVYASLPEGVMYSILLANAVTPLIDNWTQPRVFGALKKTKVKPS